MSEISGQTFGSGRVETDGRTFRGCTFNGATLIFAGGKHPVFEDCNFITSDWQFAGAALRTIQLLQRINGSPGGDKFLGDIFAPGKYFADEPVSPAA